MEDGDVAFQGQKFLPRFRLKFLSQGGHIAAIFIVGEPVGKQDEQMRVAAAGNIPGSFQHPGRCFGEVDYTQYLLHEFIIFTRLSGDSI